jgi:hypothetical protein
MLRNVTVRTREKQTKKYIGKFQRKGSKKSRTNYKGVPIKFEKVNQTYRDVCYLKKVYSDSLHHITFNLKTRFDLL